MYYIVFVRIVWACVLPCVNKRILIDWLIDWMAVGGREKSSVEQEASWVGLNDAVNRTDEQLAVVVRGNDNIATTSSRSLSLWWWHTVKKLAHETCRSFLHQISVQVHASSAYDTSNKNAQLTQRERATAVHVWRPTANKCKIRKTLYFSAQGHSRSLLSVSIETRVWLPIID